MAGGVSPRSLSGSFSFRVMHYQAICGSLAMDLTLGGLFFFIFGCCAGTETAITTLWPWKVRELAQREVERAEKTGSRRLGMWTALRSDIQRFMQTILIGATLSGVFSTAFVTEICSQLFGGSGLAIATMSVSILQLIFCEIVPKGVAVCNAYEFASVTLPWYFRISKIVYPIGRQLNRIVEVFLRMFGVSIDASKTPYVSEEELDLMLQSAMRTGILETEEGKMISSVRELDTKRVSDIMVPLVDMICIDTSESISRLHDAFSQTQYSRLPVYKDRFDNVVGIVSMKALLRRVRDLNQDDWERLTVDEVYDRPLFVPETMTVLNLLQSLKERPIAVCVDEYGGTTGLVTLEDVLEEIVGEIYDPDVERHKLQGGKRRRNDQIEDLGDGRFAMSASLDIDDVSLRIGVELPEGYYNSIGGFMADVADRIPRQGEAVIVRSTHMTVCFKATEVDERKVVRIEAERIYLEDDDADERKNGSDREEDTDEDRLERVLDVTLKPLEEEKDDDDDDEGLEEEGKEDEEEGEEAMEREKRVPSEVLSTPGVGGIAQGVGGDGVSEGTTEEAGKAKEGAAEARPREPTRKEQPEASDSASPLAGPGVVLGGCVAVGALGAAVSNASGAGSGGAGAAGAILGGISSGVFNPFHAP